MLFMSKSSYNTELTIKRLKWGIILSMGLGAFAVAQTPSSPLALPDLPAPPGASAPSGGLALPDLPALTPAQPPVADKADKPASAPKPANSTSMVANPPVLPDLPTPNKPVEPTKTEAATKTTAPVKTAEPAKTTTPATKPPADLAANPAPLPLPEIPITTTPAAESNTTAAADPDLLVNPGVAPSVPTPPPALALSLPVPGEGALATTALPEVSVEADKPAQKTWETKLASTREYPETKFHYRRVLLPSAIYREEYNEANQHLPKRVTRQDYENLLFYSAMRNDINAMRALLNQGTDINAKDANGNTALQVARASGAEVAARYLVARGAKG